VTDDPPVLHLGVGGATKCKSCEARIVFALMTSGKAMPFELDEKGLWTIENGQAVYLGKDGAQLELGQVPPVRFTSHFASCPQAPQWRSKR